MVGSVTVTPDWLGETVVLIGGGPSLTKQDVDYCKGKARVIAINDAYRLAPWADILYACDGAWWDLHNKDVTNQFKGAKWTCSLDAATKYNLNHIRHKSNPGLSFDPMLIHNGNNSGYQALNLAVLLGAKKIVLIGFDMMVRPHKSHWFGDHPRGLSQISSQGLQKFITAFNSSLTDLHKAQVSVINCSRHTALTCFPRADIQDAFDSYRSMLEAAPLLEVVCKSVPTSYSVPIEKTSPRFAQAWARGCGGVVDTSGRLAPGAVAMFGSPARWDILRQAIGEGRDWYYADHAYFGRFEYYKVTKNAYQLSSNHLGLGPNAYRFDRLKVEIKPWRNSGDFILVCPPDEKFAKLHRFNGLEWLSHVCSAISGFTDRPLMVRQREDITYSNTLSSDLVGAWCMVTYVSNAAVESVCAGVPVICLGDCAASIMGSNNLADINDPPTPDGRREWASRLAANQWTMQEIASGMAWRELQ